MHLADSPDLHNGEQDHANEENNFNGRSDYKIIAFASWVVFVDSTVEQKEAEVGEDEDHTTAREVISLLVFNEFKSHMASATSLVVLLLINLVIIDGSASGTLYLDGFLISLVEEGLFLSCLSLFCT